MFSIRLLFSNSYNSWFNLSIENYILHNMLKYQYILFLWRNHDTIVIGRAQNAWKECNTRRITRDKIQLARRKSGGGAVFHDLGNTCFTFISRMNTISKNNNFCIHIVLDSLKRLGINAFIDGRNDIMVQTNLGKRKISGSAYRYTNHGQLYHGTVLLNTDLDKMIYYLTPDEKKLESKGITSVRSRVINLVNLKSNINHNMLCYSFQKSFLDFFNQQITMEIVSSDWFTNNLVFSKMFLKQCSWEWNFGNVPDFTHHLVNRFGFGDISLHFDIEHGVISRSKIFTDSLYPEPLEELSNQLVNMLYKPDSIQYFCNIWTKKWKQYPELLEVSEWLVKNIS